MSLGIGISENPCELLYPARGVIDIACVVAAAMPTALGQDLLHGLPPVEATQRTLFMMIALCAATVPSPHVGLSYSRIFFSCALFLRHAGTSLAS